VAEPVATPIPPFVGSEWLHEHGDEVSLADVRWSLDGSQNFDTYLDGHLPDAVYVDLDSVLADPPSPVFGRHPLPSPERFARGLGAAGIGEEETVVAYDHGPGLVAARLVWMLRAIGQPAAVLDGGLAAWRGDIEVGESTRPARRRSSRPWPADRLADADLTAELSRSGDATVIDARAAERYRGESEPIDARPGHVPGAINLPAADNLDASGRLLPIERLRERYALATDAGRDVAVYCGSGVTACHDLLVIEHLGNGPGRLFPGSWSAWSGDPERAAATGPDPG
jgi:thiosulfate/3-mercaptopyruvate sulfurtransferase